MRGPWRERELLLTIPLDRAGWALRVYRKTWSDGSRCLDIQKWAQRSDGAWSFFKPAQYLQLPIEIAADVLATLGNLHEAAE